MVNKFGHLGGFQILLSRFQRNLSVSLIAALIRLVIPALMKCFKSSFIFLYHTTVAKFVPVILYFSVIMVISLQN